MDPRLGPRVITWTDGLGECSCGQTFRDDAKAQSHRCRSAGPDLLLAAWGKVRGIVTNSRALKPLG